MIERVGDEGLERAYLGDDRSAPWLFANMVTTIDGATAIDGRSSQIGDSQDTIVFRALRASADAVIVAAATARVEGYKRPRLPDHLIAWRRDRGMTDFPRIAIVTSSLDFDIGPFEDAPPVVVTSSSSPVRRRRELERITDVLVCGEARVDMTSAVDELRRSGYGRLLSEGGPSLNGQLSSDGLIDEWCVTIAPMVLSGDSKRMVVGPPLGPEVRSFRLDRALAGTDALFTRWIRDV